MANERTFKAGSNPKNYYSNVFNEGYYTIGHNLVFGNYDGAVRFPSVLGSGSCNEARLFLHCDDRSGSTGQLAFDVHGIKENNTGEFDSSNNPLSRSKTTATILWEEGTMPQENSFVPSKNVTDIVNEIRGQGGWASGNAMGFMFEKNALNTDGSWFSGGSEDVPPSVIASLVIREAAEPEFNPTPKSVAAPTFPSTDNFGLKIARPGISVLEASESDLFFTTRKKFWRTIADGKITTTGGVVYTIPHGLSYRPAVMAFIKSNLSGKRYVLPRYFPPIQRDPDGDFVNGYIEVDATNIRIYTDDSSEVYYYLFLDGQTP